MLQYVSEKRLVSGAVIARRGETPRAVLTVLTSFMVQKREARRGEVPSTEGEKKTKEKKRNACETKGDGATRTTPAGVARREKKKRKRKKKKKKSNSY